MTRQKTFKEKVRGRMQKTGERYAAARRQLIEKADRPDGPSEAATTAAAVDFQPPASEEAVRRATGKGWTEWLAILDAWNATERSHAEIARHVAEEHDTGGWWAQSVAVGYERARGKRRVHQQSGGFAVGATKTVAVGPQEAFAGFTDPGLRESWLPGAELKQRTSRPDRSARFDWLEDGSRLVVSFDARGAGKTQVAIQHEKLADEQTAQRMKAFWRERLVALKDLLEH